MFSSDSNKKFEKVLDRVTTSVSGSSNLEPDWASIMELCDMVASNAVTAKFALVSVGKRLVVEEQRSTELALTCLESLVKNCATKLRLELCSPDFVCFLRDFVINLPISARKKTLKLIETWSIAFADYPQSKPLIGLYEALKCYDQYLLEEGDESIKSSSFNNNNTSVLNKAHISAFFESNHLPEWKDGNECFTCRDPFTFTNRKHHCRHCGEIFCQACSAKKSILPHKFGIEEEVRVCDACFIEINRKNEKDKPQLSKDCDLDENEQLQLAIALSKSEEEERQKQRANNHSITYKQSEEKPIAKKQVGLNIDYSGEDKTDQSSNISEIAPTAPTHIIR